MHVNARFLLFTQGKPFGVAVIIIDTDHYTLIFLRCKKD